jgi:hypothetical protein
MSEKQQFNHCLIELRMLGLKSSNCLLFARLVDKAREKFFDRSAPVADSFSLKVLSIIGNILVIAGIDPDHSIFENQMVSFKCLYVRE